MSKRNVGYLNVAMIQGVLGSDAKVRDAGGGVVANFSVATEESYRDAKGEWKKETAWVPIQAWGKLAEIARQLKKGDEVLVSGKVKQRKYEANGKTIYVCEVQAKSIRALADLGASGPPSGLPNDRGDNSAAEYGSEGEPF